MLKPRLHDTTCCQTGLTAGCIVYTNIQLVVERFDNRLHVGLHDTPVVKQVDNRLYRVYKHSTGCIM